MNKRKGVLEKMKNYLITQNNTKIPDIYNDITEILFCLDNYYEIYDLEHDTYHKNVFNMLYIDNNGLTYEEIAEKTYLEFTTFKRYVKRYNNLALKLIKRNKNNNLETFLIDF